MLQSMGVWINAGLLVKDCAPSQECGVHVSRRETKSDARSDRDPEILAAAGITIIRDDPHAPQ